MKITMIGLDLAKSVFHVVCFDEKHKEVSKRMLRRSQVRECFAQIEPRLVERTALCNQLRALVAEYGIVMNKGVATVSRGIPLLLEDAENGLSDMFRALLARGYEQLVEIEEHIDHYTRQVEAHSRQNAHVRRLQTLPGYGPIVASVFASVVGDGKAFKCGRDVSASLGLVPRQHSSGGKEERSEGFCCWGSASGATSTCAVY